MPGGLTGSTLGPPRRGVASTAAVYGPVNAHLAALARRLWARPGLQAVCFDVTAVPSTPTATATSGRGLMIIRALTDTFDLRHGHPTGTTLRFLKRLRNTDQVPQPRNGT